MQRRVQFQLLRVARLGDFVWVNVSLQRLWRWIVNVLAVEKATSLFSAMIVVRQGFLPCYKVVNTPLQP